VPSGSTPVRLRILGDRHTKDSYWFRRGKNRSVDLGRAAGSIEFSGPDWNDDLLVPVRLLVRKDHVVRAVRSAPTSSSENGGRIVSASRCLSPLSLGNVRLPLQSHRFFEGGSRIRTARTTWSLRTTTSTGTRRSSFQSVQKIRSSPAPRPRSTDPVLAAAETVRLSCAGLQGFRQERTGVDPDGTRKDRACVRLAQTEYVIDRDLEMANSAGGAGRVRSANQRLC